MNIRDASIHAGKENSATSPDYIKSQILAPQIEWAGTFIVYITPKTRQSTWVDWEIEYAEKKGKQIIGVWGHGDNNCEVRKVSRSMRTRLSDGMGIASSMP
jgi:hypothetical protein